MATATTADRKWRLRAWETDDKKDHPTVDETLVGDRALDAELKRLEADPAIVRTTVAAG